jgi:hypothetical protein
MLFFKVILAMIIQKLQFSSEPDAQDPGRKFWLSMVPRNPIHLIFAAIE